MRLTLFTPAYIMLLIWKNGSMIPLADISDRIIGVSGIYPPKGDCPGFVKIGRAPSHAGRSPPLLYKQITLRFLFSVCKN